jgi:citrate lyase beta subunit
MTERKIRSRRSLLFAPADRPELFAKALATGADMVCVDLEDAVPTGDKAAARSAAMAMFAAPQADDGVERLLRINSLRGPEGLRDIDAILASPAPPPALLLPKVETPDEVRLLGELLGQGPQADIRFHVIIETNAGLEAAHEIARASPRLDLMAFGGVDMAAELRARPTWEAFFYTRTRLVNAAAGAGIDLLDVPHLDLSDHDGMVADAERSLALGYTGKAAIHPSQVAAINAVFSPPANEVARAREIIAAFEASADGVVVIDGKLIEVPVLRSMRRLVAVAERIAAR